MLRSHCVSVRLSDDELAQLDAQRGKHKRGEWLRMAGLDRLPRPIPELNRAAWADLARLANNLNQAQRSINSGDASAHDTRLIEATRLAVDALRDQLLGLR